MPCYIVLQWCNLVLSVIIVLCCFIMLVYKIIMLCCVLLCWFVMFLYCFVHTCFSLLQWHHGTSEAQSFYTNASQSSHLPTFTTDTIHAAIWYNADDPKRFLHSWHKQHRHFLVLTMHQAQRVSNDTSHPSHLPVYTPDTIYACLQFQRRWPKAFPKALYLLSSHRLL